MTPPKAPRSNFDNHCSVPAPKAVVKFDGHCSVAAPKAPWSIAGGEAPGNFPPNDIGPERAAEYRLEHQDAFRLFVCWAFIPTLRLREPSIRDPFRAGVVGGKLPGASPLMK